LAWYEYRPYVSAAQRMQSASRELAKRKKKGLTAEPVTIEGRTIARSFWGKAWCDHLEGYSDYANRLPRGRTYVRNGSVLHLTVGPGCIEALVQGSSLYEVSVDVTPLARPRWKGLVDACSGKIDSLVELLRGKLSDGVMRVVTDRDKGLFPAPSQIRMECSCPDWATMCKHVAAVLYGIGARLDERPELLFTLRKVDHLELLSAGATTPGPAVERSRERLRNRDRCPARDGRPALEVPAGRARAGHAYCPGPRRPGRRAPLDRRRSGGHRTHCRLAQGEQAGASRRADPRRPESGREGPRSTDRRGAHGQKVAEDGSNARDDLLRGASRQAGSRRGSDDVPRPIVQDASLNEA
jgi:uncharacterized Zn finger protein